MPLPGTFSAGDPILATDMNAILDAILALQKNNVIYQTIADSNTFGASSTLEVDCDQSYDFPIDELEIGDEIVINCVMEKSGGESSTFKNYFGGSNRKTMTISSAHSIIRLTTRIKIRTNTTAYYHVEMTSEAGLVSVFKGEITIANITSATNLWKVSNQQATSNGTYWCQMNSITIERKREL